jgi:hypothetical protein
LSQRLVAEFRWNRDDLGCGGQQQVERGGVSGPGDGVTAILQVVTYGDGRQDMAGKRGDDEQKPAHRSAVTVL